MLKKYGLASDPNDGFLDIHHTWFWEVILSNGLTVFQDDGRHGIPQHSAWIRLYNYVSENNVSINSFRVRFRTNSYNMPDKQRGYYFSKGFLQGAGASVGLEYYVLGFVTGDNVYFSWLRVPELIIINTYVKPVTECVPPYLILNPLS